MKKILFFSAVVAMIIACGGKSYEGSVTEAEGLEFDSVVVDTTVALTSEKGSPEAKVHISMMYAKKGDKAKEINATMLNVMLNVEAKGGVKATIDSFATRFVKDYKRNYAPLYSRDRENKSSYNVTLRYNTRVQHYVDNVVCYLVEAYNFAGGEYAMNWTQAYNIDIKTGHILALEDILKQRGENIDPETLTERIVKELCAQFDTKDLEGLREKGLFVGIEPYATNNVILKDDGLEFIYVDSEIAPHDVGEIRVTLK